MPSAVRVRLARSFWRSSASKQRSVPVMTTASGMMARRRKRFLHALGRRRMGSAAAHVRLLHPSNQPHGALSKHAKKETTTRSRRMRYPY